MLGAHEGLRSRVNELDLKRHHEHLFGAAGLVAGWLADGPVRAPGYAIDWLPHPLPEEVLEPFAVLQSSMNDAPRGTLDVEDQVYTAASLRHLDDASVAPEHRGHALGKWLKALMLERLHRERPDVGVVRTGNADTNAAMLAINAALGFAVAREAIVWQVAADELAQRLEAPAARGA